jgi:hypothetical protein
MEIENLKTIKLRQGYEGESLPNMIVFYKKRKVGHSRNTHPERTLCEHEDRNCAIHL